MGSIMFMVDTFLCLFGNGWSINRPKPKPLAEPMPVLNVVKRRRSVTRSTPVKSTATCDDMAVFLRLVCWRADRGVYRA